MDNGRTELLHILEKYLPAKCSTESNEAASLGGELVFEDEITLSETTSDPHALRLRIPGLQSIEAESDCIEIKVRFADDADVPFPFRGRICASKASHSVKYLQCGQDEKVLASDDLGCLWVVSAGGGPKQYRSAFTLPPLPPSRMFQKVFNGDRFMELLPVIHFLREVGRNDTLAGPPLRACFIFDDPNLHWSRYGFVDFQQIAAHAAKENYHVSFATIPLDAWFTHKPTAELFRKNTKYLSLCVHGNNHTREELAGNYSQSARVSLLGQAISRVERLERNAGVRVCRVMVPPHGACTEEMLAELPGCGFEAACVSHGSLHAYNQSKPWIRQLGLSPSEMIAGCPVLPRWAMTGNVRNNILVAVFLGQPIILRGHHQDLKPGIKVLDELARFVNGLGSVSWSNLTELSRTYLRRDVRALVNEISAQPQVVVPIGSNGTQPVAANGVCRLNARAFARRLLTEGRDRLLP